MPGLSCTLERCGFETILWIAGHCVEAPEHLAVRGVVRRDIAAHAHFAAAVADDHFAGDDARCAGDGVAFGWIGGLHRPRRLAGHAIERDQTTIERADEDPIAPGRDAAIDHVATGVDGFAAFHLGIETPQFAPAASVERKYFAPRRSHIHRAVDHDGRRFLAARGVEVEEPGEFQLFDVAGVQPRQRTESLLVVGTPMRQPIGIVTGRTKNPGGVDWGGRDGKGVRQCKGEDCTMDQASYRGTEWSHRSPLCARANLIWAATANLKETS
jgi:hypothetical protein